MLEELNGSTLDELKAAALAAFEAMELEHALAYERGRLVKQRLNLALDALEAIILADAAINNANSCDVHRIGPAPSDEELDALWERFSDTVEYSTDLLARLRSETIR